MCLFVDTIPGSDANVARDFLVPSTLSESPRPRDESDQGVEGFLPQGVRPFVFLERVKMHWLM